MFHRTAFQKKLLEFTWGRKAEQGHWFPKDGAPTTIKPPGLADIVTTKRAVYAAFLGPIPANVDLRSNCGARSCWCPWHQTLEQSRRMSRPLELPDAGVARSGYAAIVEHDRLVAAPEGGVVGISQADANRVKHLAKTNPLASVAAMCGITVPQVVRVLNGKVGAAPVVEEKEGAPVPAKETPAGGEATSQGAQDWLRTVS